MHKVLKPEGWAPPKGYADGILSSDGSLFVAGQVGWNASHVFEADDFIGQMEQALKNIVTVVEAAGGHVNDIVRLTWYVIDKTEYLPRQREAGEVYRRVMGYHFPAMTLVIVAGLIEEGALLEIEATAVLSGEKK